MFEALPQIVWITRPDGWPEHYNQRWFDFTGLTPEESLGGGWDAIHPDDRARARARWDEATTTGEPYEIEYRLRRHDGAYRWMLGRALPVRDDAGGIVHWVGTCTDIDDGRRARAQLEHTQRLQQVAGTTARVGGWTLEVATGQLYWDAMMYEMYELAEGEEVDLAEALDLYLPDSRARLDLALDACIADGTPFDLELQLRTYRGAPRWVRAIGEAARGRDLAVTHLYGALQDITKRKEATLAKDELARRLSTTLESITDGYFTLDRNWRFTYLNGIAAELLRRDRDELLGRSMWAEFPEGLGTEAEVIYRRAMERGEPTMLPAYHFPPLDRWFEIHAFPSEEGLTVSFRDVTVQRADRAALHERMKEAEALAAISRGATALTDPDELVTRTAGHLRDAMREPEAVGVEVVLDDAQARAGRLDGAPRILEVPIVAEGARRGHLAVHDRTGAALLPEEDALVRTVAETLSLWSERHRAARALHEANVRLTDANAALEAASRLKDDLLSMASHELRTPLTPIIGFLELLQTRGARLEEEQKAQVVRIMRTHATRMLRLVDDLLIVSRATAQVLESRPEDVWAHEVLAQVLDELGDTAGLQDVELAVDGCRLHVDPQHLQQIAFNLITNAAKYGEPPITITAVPVAEGRVAIEVADQGPGIPAAFQRRMWERFEQRDRGNTRTSRGTGLGLAIVKLLAETNGGTVGYRKGEPRGSVFTVELTGRIG